MTWKGDKRSRMILEWRAYRLVRHIDLENSRRMEAIPPQVEIPSGDRLSDPTRWAHAIQMNEAINSWHYKKLAVFRELSVPEKESACGYALSNDLLQSPGSFGMFQSGARLRVHPGKGNAVLTNRTFGVPYAAIDNALRPYGITFIALLGIVLGWLIASFPRLIR